MDMKSNDRHDDPAASASAGPAIKSVLFWIEPRKMTLFKAIIESYDNLATLRTEDPIHHRLRLYYGIESEADVMDLLDRIAAEFLLRRLE
ncbi:MAG: DUF4911 domain-containing protein [Candidatus Binataceae bacterium]|nr:DUF4911 domain-containing protein [Candidatus Binataceae bacterium]